MNCYIILISIVQLSMVYTILHVFVYSYLTYKCIVILLISVLCSDNMIINSILVYLHVVMLY